MQGNRRVPAAVGRLRVHGRVSDRADVRRFSRAENLRWNDRDHEGSDCAQVAGMIADRISRGNDAMSITTHRICLLLCALFALQLSACSNSSKEAQGCAQLKDLKLEHTQIVAAEFHSAGHEMSLMTTPVGLPWFNVPASCRVKLVFAPSADSHIESEVWMPTTAWNGRLWSAGNGGLAGSL